METITILQSLIFIPMYILWCWWAAYQGKEEAYAVLGSLAIKKHFDVDLSKEITNHSMWTKERVVVALMLLIPCLFIEDRLVISLGMMFSFGLSLVLSFSFWHNGYYYVFVNRIYDKVGYQKPYTGFKHNKGTSNHLHFSFKARTIHLIVSVIILILLSLRYEFL